MTPVDAMMNTVEWKAIQSDVPPLAGDDLPYATHEGKLEIGGFEFQCYQLSNGARVISEESLLKFFGGIDVMD
ncbi:MAG TPA: hypothetical protein VHO25_18785 [Polyangiaceae bacterium]|nr:hypothetical protein [Polyangiaceae bacterium]